MTGAWEPIVDRLTTERYPRLLSHAFMLVGNRTEAEDLVQEALIATFGKRRGFESLAEAEQYVRRAIVTKFIDKKRKSSKERELWYRAMSGSEASIADPSGSIGGALDVGQALRSLPVRQRACVALRFLDDLSVSQTAAALGLSEGAVKRYVFDGLKALNATLGTTESLESLDLAPVQAGPGGAA